MGSIFGFLFLSLVMGVSQAVVTIDMKYHDYYLQGFRCLAGSKINTLVVEKNSGTCESFENPQCAPKCEWGRDCRIASFDLSKTYLAGLGTVYDYKTNGTTIMKYCCQSTSAILSSCIWMKIPNALIEHNKSPNEADENIIRDFRRLSNEGRSLTPFDIIVAEVCMVKRGNIWCRPTGNLNLRSLSVPRPVLQNVPPAPRPLPQNIPPAPRPVAPNFQPLPRPVSQNFGPVPRPISQGFAPTPRPIVPVVRPTPHPALRHFEPSPRPILPRFQPTPRPFTPVFQPTPRPVTPNFEPALVTEPQSFETTQAVTDTFDYDFNPVTVPPTFQPTLSPGSQNFPIITRPPNAENQAFVPTISPDLKLDPNEKFLRCCKNNPKISPQCYNLCSFNGITKQGLFLAFVTKSCPGSTAFYDILDCASSKQDHTPCCMKAGLQELAGGVCMQLCNPRTLTKLDPGLLPCADRLSDFTSCFKQYLNDH